MSYLNSLTNLVCENIEDLLESLDVDFKRSGNLIYAPCIVHGGNNEKGLNLYINEGDYGLYAKWRCNTHQCHKKYKDSVIGLFSGFFSATEGRNFTFTQTVNKLCKLLGVSLNNLQDVVIDKEKSKYMSLNKTSVSNPSKQYTADYVRKKLQIPATYYIGRGYSEKILTKYDIGLAVEGYMKDRVITPIYDNEGKFMIGFSGRTTNGEEPKWVHSKGFRRSQSLYNLWFSRDFIKESQTVVITESPGNVWRLEEAGIHNAVAIYGNYMSDTQAQLLFSLPVINMVVVLDNDEAGLLGSAEIFEKFKKVYNVRVVKLPDGINDIGEMTVDKIKESLQL